MHESLLGTPHLFSGSCRLNWAELLQTHGYWALALGCLLEGESLLVLAGFAAHRGLLDPFAVMSVAAVAGYAGDQMFFWLGRRRGARVLARWPSLGRQSDRVDALIERWHAWLIIGIRFAYGLRIAGPILIGMSSVSSWRFAVLNAIGAILWAILFSGVGWVFGAAAEAVLGETRHLGGELLLALASIIAFAWSIRWWHRRRRERGDAGR